MKLPRFIVLKKNYKSTMNTDVTGKVLNQQVTNFTVSKSVSN